MTDVVKLKRIYVQEDRDFDDWPYFHHRVRKICIGCTIGIILCCVGIYLTYVY